MNFDLHFFQTFFDKIEQVEKKFQNNNNNDNNNNNNNNNKKGVCFVVDNISTLFALSQSPLFVFDFFNYLRSLMSKNNNINNNKVILNCFYYCYYLFKNYS